MSKRPSSVRSASRYVVVAVGLAALLFGVALSGSERAGDQLVGALRVVAEVSCTTSNGKSLHLSLETGRGLRSGERGENFGLQEWRLWRSEAKASGERDLIWQSFREYWSSMPSNTPQYSLACSPDGQILYMLRANRSTQATAASVYTFPLSRARALKAISREEADAQTPPPLPFPEPLAVTEFVALNFGDFEVRSAFLRRSGRDLYVELVPSSLRGEAVYFRFYPVQRRLRRIDEKDLPPGVRDDRIRPVGVGDLASVEILGTCECEGANGERERYELRWAAYSSPRELYSKSEDLALVTLDRLGRGPREKRELLWVMTKDTDRNGPTVVAGACRCGEKTGEVLVLAAGVDGGRARFEAITVTGDKPLPTDERGADFANWDWVHSHRSEEEMKICRFRFSAEREARYSMSLRERGDELEITVSGETPDKPLFETKFHKARRRFLDLRVRGVETECNL